MASDPLTEEVAAYEADARREARRDELLARLAKEVLGEDWSPDGP